MSLVNDMLKDLDRRRRMPFNNDSARLVYSDDEDNGTSKLKLLGVVVIVASITSGVAGYIVLKDSVPMANPQAATPISEPLLMSRTAEAAPEVVRVAPAVETSPQISARIAGERNRSNGFELRIEASEKVPFEVIDRTDSSLRVLLSGVDRLSNAITSLSGVEAAQAPEGLMINVDLARGADFVVYENSNDFTFALNIEVFWKQVAETITAVGATPADDITAPDAGTAQVATATVTDTPIQADSAARNETIATNSNRTVAPVRTQRELSLQDRDRNASQLALQKAQNGQMQAAYSALYEFISDNPEAHQSRNTLITLLYAQQQYDQVGMLVREGLLLAPNLSSYKKMKARLLMMQGESQQAIDLLRNVPPVVSEDKEYYELLASLYQQTGNYMAAISTYQDLIRTDTNVGRWWAGMGISHESMGNVREAVNSFEVALQTPSLESSLRQYSRNRIRSLSGQ